MLDVSGYPHSCVFQLVEQRANMCYQTMLAMTFKQLIGYRLWYPNFFK